MRPDRGVDEIATMGRCQFARVLPVTQPTLPFHATTSRSSSLPAKNAATCCSCIEVEVSGDEATGGATAPFAARTGFPTGGRKPGHTHPAPAAGGPAWAMEVEKLLRIRSSTPT